MTYVWLDADWWHTPTRHVQTRAGRIVSLAPEVNIAY